MRVSELAAEEDTHARLTGEKLGIAMIDPRR
jgi:hypothetical protein